ncbi:hypothetical protein ACVBEQ_06945 [Nakamurella sp. GG22]
MNTGTGMAILAAVWSGPRDVDRLVSNLLETGAAGPVDRLNVAALGLTPDGRLRIHRHGRTDQGVLISGVVGAALGILAGGPGWLLLGGGPLERLAAAAIGAGMESGPLRNFADRLPTGGSAVLAVAANDVATALHRELVVLDGEVTVQHIDAVVVRATGLSAAVRYDAADADGDVIAIRGARGAPFSPSRVGRTPSGTPAQRDG